MKLKKFTTVIIAVVAIIAVAFTVQSFAAPEPSATASGATSTITALMKVHAPILMAMDIPAVMARKNTVSRNGKPI